MRITLALIFTFSVILNSASAQIDKPVRWSYLAKKVSKTEAVIYLKATVQNGWHIYAQNIQGSEALKTKFSFSPSKIFTLSGKTEEPKPIVKYEKVLKMNLSYFEREVVFQQKIKFNKNAFTIKGKVEFTACTTSKCLPAEEIDFSIPVK
jgi:DsbC/DsbD-like thiol-disulfide interchange protein